MVGSRALVLRAGGVIALTVAVAVAFAVTLAFFKFDQKLLDVTASRLAVVAQEVRRQVETGLALGLDIAELDDLKSVVDRAARAADVTRVDLADVRGVVRFSSDAGGEGRALPPLSSAAMTEGKGEDSYRRAIDGDRAMLTVPLRNGFGEPAGTVMVEATVAAQRAQEREVRGELMAAAAPVIAAALAVTLLAVMLTVRWSVGGEDEQGNDEAGDGDAATAGLTATSASLHATLEPRLTAAIATADAALEEVDRTLFPAAGRAGR